MGGGGSKPSYSDLNHVSQQSSQQNRATQLALAQTQNHVFYMGQGLASVQEKQQNTQDSLADTRSSLSETQSSLSDTQNHVFYMGQGLVLYHHQNREHQMALIQNQRENQMALMHNQQNLHVEAQRQANHRLSQFFCGLNEAGNKMHNRFDVIETQGQSIENMVVVKSDGIMSVVQQGNELAANNHSQAMNRFDQFENRHLQTLEAFGKQSAEDHTQVMGGFQSLGTQINQFNGQVEQRINNQTDVIFSGLKMMDSSAKDRHNSNMNGFYNVQEGLGTVKTCNIVIISLIVLLVGLVVYPFYIKN